MSPMFTVRSLSISGLYLSYESMATLAYRILVRSRVRPGVAVVAVAPWHLVGRASLTAEDATRVCACAIHRL